MPKWLSERKAILLGLINLGAFIFFFLGIPFISGQIQYTSFISWIPEIGLNLEFVLDGLSSIFALLITGIGSLVFFYSYRYMKGYSGTKPFYFYLFLFGGAMLGLVLSGNLIQLFIFWELTSFLSFLLINFFHEKPEARRAAFQSLFITVFGGLSLLSGIILIGSDINSYSINVWIANADIIKASNHYVPGLILILIGVFTKSAQFPFHFWLPGAMQAPTPVSAYLHSATMVKAGVFLLARLSPALGGTFEWTHIIPLAGVITMLIGSYFAITQTNLKPILAYTTINALGVLVLLIGIDTKLSIKAAMLFLIIHAFYKATLFMVAGIIDKKAGTMDINKLGGLLKYLPITFIITLLAALSMAGLPPMLGFLGKELIYEAKIQSPGIANLVLFLGVASNVLMIAVSLFFVYKIFLGNPQPYEKKPNEKGPGFWLGPLVLVVLSLFFGLFPSILGSTLVESAVSTVREEDIVVKLKLWHGFNDVFFLSLFTVILGFALFFLLIKRERLMARWRALNKSIFKIKLTELFDKTMEGFVNFTTRKSRAIQHGYHRYYILTIILFTSVLIWYQVFVTGGFKLNTSFSLHPFYISGLIAVIISATAFSIFAKTRITSIGPLGVIGYGISLIYLYYGAIDLSITQIIVETIIIAMFDRYIAKVATLCKVVVFHHKVQGYNCSPYIW
ncbi:MAG: proton-conducting transporter membrane subunit [Bacteroidales bacterium]